MVGITYSITYIAIFIIAFIAMGFSIYNFARMLSEVRPEKRMLANFIAPVILFVPDIFTEKGIRNKYLFLLGVGVAALLVFLLIFLESLYGKPPYMQH
jgi:hypothetical protein